MRITTNRKGGQQGPKGDIDFIASSFSLKQSRFSDRTVFHGYGTKRSSVGPGTTPTETARGPIYRLIRPKTPSLISKVAERLFAVRFARGDLLRCNGSAPRGVTTGAKKGTERNRTRVVVGLQLKLGLV